MNSERSYSQILLDYSQKVQDLFSSPSDSVGERGFRGPTSFENLADQAEDLIELSDQLNLAATDELLQAIPEQRIQHGTSLMAKSLVDLEISATLLEAALDLEENQPFQSNLDEERRARSKGQIDLLVEIMNHDDQVERTEGDLPNERALKEYLDPPTIRFALQGAVEDGLDLITSRAGRLSQEVIFELINIDGLNLPSLLNDLASGLSGIVEVVEPGKRLLELYQGYIIRSIESLQKFIGSKATEIFVEQVISWMNPLKGGKIMTSILETLYGISQSEANLVQLIDSSQRDLHFFQLATDEIEHLLNEHQRQIQLGEKINTGLGILGSISSALVLPIGGALLTVGKVVLGAFIVTASGDYLDAPSLKLLNHVPGIPSLVESRLAFPVNRDSDS